jgi:hypothetical protein
MICMLSIPAGMPTWFGTYSTAASIDRKLFLERLLPPPLCQRPLPGHTD